MDAQHQKQEHLHFPVRHIFYHPGQKGRTDIKRHNGIHKPHMACPGKPGRQHLCQIPAGMLPDRQNHSVRMDIITIVNKAIDQKRNSHRNKTLSVKLPDALSLCSMFFSVCLIQKTFLRRNTQDLMCSLSVQAKLHTHPHFLHVQGLRHSGFCPQ